MTEPSAPEDSPTARTGLAAAGLLVALGASGMLVAQHLGGISLPGCGPESACASVARGPFGSIPLLEWPTSFFGLAWFLGLGAGWLAVRRRVSRFQRLATRLGALGSIVWIGVMLTHASWCPWCLVVHAGNFCWLAATERVGPPVPSTSRGVLAAGSTFLVAILALLVGEQKAAGLQVQREEHALAVATEALTAGSESDVDRGFTGRWREGPDLAAVRVVIFTDYQCPDCRALEVRLHGLRARFPDLSLSVKHYPMCTDCNRWAARNLHPNACWAARAAEAAGELGGDEAFFAMHRWLFEQSGRFDVDALRGQAVAQGLDPGALRARMHAAESLARVEADVAEAQDLGLQSTPAVFVNGVEITGWRAPDGLARAFEAAGLAPRTADRPPEAMARFLSLWREAPEAALPDSRWAWRAPGSEGPPVLRVTAWLDFTESTSAEAHRGILAALSEHRHWAYVVHPFPLGQECNPATQRTGSEGACLAALCVEAAGLAGGGEAHRALIDELCREPGPVTEARVRLAAGAIGIDADDLLERARSAVVQQRVSSKARAAAQLGLHALPLIFVDGRQVAHWRPQGRPVLEKILDAAAGR